MASEDLKPIDYARVLRPRSREELISEGIDVAGTRRMEELGWTWRRPHLPRSPGQGAEAGGSDAE